jgi:ABC-type ATPase with predicted acetyltransferase domain
MNCICGYTEPEEWSEEVDVLYVSGKRKGELKEVKTIYHEVDEKDKFIPITVEKDFGFVVVKHQYYFGRCESMVSLYACPKCFTIRMEGY